MTTTASGKRPAQSQLALVLIVLLLSLFLISQGLLDYVTRPDVNVVPSNVPIFLGLGVLSLMVSVYWIFMARQRMIKMLAAETQPLSTALVCQKCGLRNLRDFQRGDYIFKTTDEACPKDNEKMLISAIYREVPEKEKAKEMGYS